MQTVLGLAIFGIGCIAVALGIYGARLLYRVEKGRRKAIRQSAPPSMPRIYPGTIMDELRKKKPSSSYSISLN